MFDLRYHVVSLAAVFIAFVIGVVVGVGVSGRGLIKETERAKLQLQIDDLNRANKRNQARIRELQAASDYQRETYDAVMRNRLADQRVALVFVGSTDGEILTRVKQTLEDAGGRLVRWRALKVPIEEVKVRAALRDVPDAPQSLPEIGRMLASELVGGGDTPLWDSLGNLFVEERVGGMQLPVEGVVVARSADPQRGPTARFLAGFYRGLASGGVPAVAVEKSDKDPTTIPPFESAGFVSSVDDIETQTGRVSLAVLLQGAETGHFGIKEDKEPVPPVPPVVPPG
ncbi:MAG TPA: copper transporter [Gaiellaceae bacterium]|nr:copper transporter [Gaiellaceae bacterium]